MDEEIDFRAMSPSDAARVFTDLVSEVHSASLTLALKAGVRRAVTGEDGDASLIDSIAEELRQRRCTVEIIDLALKAIETVDPSHKPVVGDAPIVIAARLKRTLGRLRGLLEINHSAPGLDKYNGEIEGLEKLLLQARRDLSAMMFVEEIPGKRVLKCATTVKMFRDIAIKALEDVGMAVQRTAPDSPERREATAGPWSIATTHLPALLTRALSEAPSDGLRKMLSDRLQRVVDAAKDCTGNANRHRSSTREWTGLYGAFNDGILDATPVLDEIREAEVAAIEAGPAIEKTQVLSSPAYRLLTWLADSTDIAVPVADLPDSLRDGDLLTICESQGVIYLKSHCRWGVTTLDSPIPPYWSLQPRAVCGYGGSVHSAMAASAKQTEPMSRLFVQMSEKGGVALAEQRLAETELGKPGREQTTSTNPDQRAPAGVWRAAKWYDTATNGGLYPDLLGKAGREGRIRTWTPPGTKRCQYEFFSVRGVYSDWAPRLDAALNDEKTRTNANEGEPTGKPIKPTRS